MQWNSYVKLPATSFSQVTASKSDRFWKKHYNSAAKAWIIDNPGKPIGLYDIPGLASSAFAHAMNVENITAGFRVTGIYPHNSNKFMDEKFLPSQVTKQTRSAFG